MIVAATTLLALTAFAGNSVLCRLALGDGAMDPASFTLIRIAAGAVTLPLLLWIQKTPQHDGTASGSWFGAACLLTYAVAFSYAYVQLESGVGALVLFGSVQITMLLFALRAGEKLGLIKAIGMLCAGAGLTLLLLPGTTDHQKVSATGFSLMVIAGMAWAGYTLLGAQSKSALRDTTFNFVRATALALPLASIFLIAPPTATPSGIALAIASGALTSGVGYAIWYAVLPRISRLQAGVSQLSVPVITALGGIVFIGEQVDTRLVVAMTLTLAGIFITLSRPAAQS